MNSSGPSARGVSVYYPNMNYKSEIGRNGEVLAKDIIKKIKGLGYSSARKRNTYKKFGK